MGSSSKSSSLCGRGPKHESEDWWEARLPADYTAILGRAVNRPQYSTNKDLYCRLCQPFLIDQGTTSFELDKDTGKKCYRLSARVLYIVWGDTPTYWIKVEDACSRFTEVAKLVSVCWLDISGKINTSELSLKTTYTAYLIFKLTPDSFGLSRTQEASISVANQEIAKSEVCLKPQEKHGDEDSQEARPKSNIQCNWIRKKTPPPGVQVPSTREDGWMELPLGEFNNNGRISGEMKMSLREVVHLNWKGGLIVEGIEVRPRGSSRLTEDQRCALKVTQ